FNVNFFLFIKFVKYFRYRFLNVDIISYKSYSLHAVPTVFIWSYNMTLGELLALFFNSALLSIQSFNLHKVNLIYINLKWVKGKTVINIIESILILSRGAHSCMQWMIFSCRN
ncbi:hypothetical protein AVW22_22195, partial [Salmonella enterica]|nr:hypothetical protein [Salmonella enterica]